MKYLYKPAALMFFISTLFFSCKKSSTPPALVTFIKFDANTKAINYNSCFTTELIDEGQPETSITTQGGSGSFNITLSQAPGDLKAGQVYEAATFTSTAYNVVFTYVPTDTTNGGYGYASSPYNPIGSVTLTEATPTSIKGTFTTSVYYNSGLNLAYTITNGSFCSGPPVYAVAL